MLGDWIFVSGFSVWSVFFSIRSEFSCVVKVVELSKLSSEDNLTGITVPNSAFDSPVPLDDSSVISLEDFEDDINLCDFENINGNFFVGLNSVANVRNSITIEMALDTTKTAYTNTGVKESS